MFLQCIWSISCQRNKIVWLFSCITLIVVNIKSLLAETKLLSGVAWWEGQCSPATPGSCIGKQLWEKSPIKQIKLLGIDKRRGSYAELRSGNKWENMKAYLLKHVNIVANRVSKTLFVTTVTCQFVTQNSRAIFQYLVCWLQHREIKSIALQLVKQLCKMWN